MKDFLRLIEQIQKYPDNQELTDRFLAIISSNEENFLNQQTIIEGLGVCTPLMYAAYLGAYEAVALLLQESVVKLQAISHEFYTALDWAYASKTPHFLTIDLLLRTGAKTANELKKNQITPAENSLQRNIHTFVENKGNTHNNIADESINNAIKKLKKRYSNIDVAQILTKIRNEIDKLPNIKKVILNGFLTHDFMESEYNNSGDTLKIILCLVWIATTDKDLFKDAPDERIQILFNRMIDATRGADGVCVDGRVHALIETLDRVHEDVAIMYGNAAVIDVLLMRYNRLFHQRLLDQEKSKKLIISAISENENDQKYFLEYFNSEKQPMINLLRAEYPQTFIEGLIAVFDKKGKEIAIGPSVYFSQHLTADDIPLKIEGLEEIRQLQQFHNWLCGLSKNTATTIVGKQQDLSLLISDKLTKDNTQTFAEAYKEILIAAKKLYYKSGWVFLATAHQSLPYFANLKILISNLSEELRDPIASEIQGLEYSEEKALDPIFDIICETLKKSKFLQERNITFTTDLLKQTLAITSALDQWGCLPAPQFIITNKACKVKNKILAGLGIQGWLSEKQIQQLQDDFEERTVTVQGQILEVLRLLHTMLHSPRPVEQNKAQEELLNIIFDPNNIATKNELFQELLLNEKDKQRNTFSHRIADVNIPTLFTYYLVSIYKKKPSALQELNASGMSAIRLACKAKNTAFFAFLCGVGLYHQIDNNGCFSYEMSAKFKDDFIETAFSSILKYHDNTAAIYLMGKFAGTTLIEKIKNKNFQYNYHDLHFDFLKWYLTQYPNDFYSIRFICQFAIPRSQHKIIDLMFTSMPAAVKDSEYISILQTIEHKSKLPSFVIAVKNNSPNTLGILIKHCPQTLLEISLTQTSQFVTRHSSGHHFVSDENALSIAVRLDDGESIQKLITAYTGDKIKYINDSKTTVCNFYPHSAFSFAVMEGKTLAVQAIIDSLPDDKSKLDLLTQSCWLLKATVRNDDDKAVQVADILINALPNPDKSTILYSRNPFKYTALFSAKPKMIKKLIATCKGETSKIYYLNEKNKDGNTALYHRANGQLSLQQEMIVLEFIKELINAYPHVNKTPFILEKNNNNETVLHAAARYNKKQTIIFILNTLPDLASKQECLNARAENGDTVFDILQKNNNFDFIKRLKAYIPAPEEVNPSTSQANSSEEEITTKKKFRLI